MNDLSLSMGLREVPNVQIALPMLMDKDASQPSVSLAEPGTTKPDTTKLVKAVTEYPSVRKYASGDVHAATLIMAELFRAGVQTVQIVDQSRFTLHDELGASFPEDGSRNSRDPNKCSIHSTLGLSRCIISVGLFSNALSLAAIQAFSSKNDLLLHPGKSSREACLFVKRFNTEQGSSPEQNNNWTVLRCEQSKQKNFEEYTDHVVFSRYRLNKGQYRLFVLGGCQEGGTESVAEYFSEMLREVEARENSCDHNEKVGVASSFTAIFKAKFFYGNNGFYSPAERRAPKLARRALHTNAECLFFPSSDE
jgi:hypothetical protein